MVWARTALTWGAASSAVTIGYVTWSSIISGGSPSQLVWMITCTSEMSGSASRGMRCIDQMPAMTSRNVAVKTRNRLRAHHSIIHVIKLHSSRGVKVELLAGNYAPVLADGNRDHPGPT